MRRPAGLRRERSLQQRLRLLVVSCFMPLAAVIVLLLAPEFFAPLREIGLRRHARLEAMTALGTLAPLLAEPKTAGHQPMTATTAPAIRFEAVRVVHDDGRVALDGFDLDIAAGAMTELNWQKETLLEILIGLFAQGRQRSRLQRSARAGTSLPTT